jgi:hypothetical protein
MVQDGELIPPARKGRHKPRGVKRMKLNYLALAALLLFGATCGQAQAATWQHFGADKAYTSRAAAIADAPRVMRQVGYPEPVVALLTEAMKKAGDTNCHVVNGMVLPWMRSGTAAVWRSVRVAFDKPPVSDNMEYSAPCEKWVVEWNGRTWGIGRPEICNNLFGIAGSPPPTRTVYRNPPPPHCPMIMAHVPDGAANLVFIQLTATGRVPASRGCPFLYQAPGDTGWYSLPTHCPEAPCDHEQVIAASGLQPGPSGGVNVKGRPGVYKFQVTPEAAASPDFVYAFCVVMEDETGSCAVDVRSTDYHAGVATIFSEQEIPSSWRWRRLYWAFREGLDCEFE